MVRFASSHSSWAVEVSSAFSAPCPGHLAQAAGRRPGQVLGVAGKDFFQFFADVDVFVELVDQVIAQRFERIVSFFSSRPLVWTQSSVLSAWRSVQIAKTLRKARTEPRITSPLTTRRRPRLMGGWYT